MIKHGITILESNESTYNSETHTIKYNSNSSFVHELVHALDHASGWELSKKYYKVIRKKIHPIKLRGIQKVYSEEEWECEFLAFYFEWSIEIQEIFFESYSLQEAVLETEKFMCSVLF